MRKTGLMVGRILALCLAFILGFSSAFGAIAGGIYFAFAELSVDKINQWGELFGFSIPVDEFVDQEAEKPATSLSLQDLIFEIQELTTNALTLEQMIERYGLLLPPDVIAKIPEPVLNEVPFASLFTPAGIQVVMDSITVADVMAMIPEELAGTIVSDPLRDAMSDRTLSDVVAMDVGYIFNGVELGYLTGVTYVLDEKGEYQPVWADPENPTLPELIAPLDLGGVLSEATSGGDVLEVIKNSIGDVAVQSILGVYLADVVIINNLLGEVTLGELIVLDESSGKHTIDINVAMEGRKVGALLGYTEVEVTDPETSEVAYEWHDGEGKKITGITTKVADIYLTDFMNGTVSFDTILNDLIIADVLGYEKGESLPVFMHDNLENPLVVDDEIVVWYLEDTPADKIMNAFADKTLDWISTSVSTLKLADILGYYCYEDEWYVWNVEKVGGSDAIVLTPGTPIMSEIAGTTIDGLGSIENTLKDIKIGTLLGYESICDENGNHLYWSMSVDENGNHVEPTGITAAVADLTINGLSNGDLQTTIDGITLADVLGYTKGDDGKWYKGEELITGPMAALAESSVGNIANDINSIAIGEMLGHTRKSEVDENGETIEYWVDENGEKVTGIMGAFVDLSIDDLKDGDKVQDSIQNIKVADVMGLYEENGVWYNSDGTKATGVMSALAGTEVGDLSTAMQTIKIGQLLDLYQDEDGVWRNSDGSRASGAIAALANSSVATLNSDINNVKVGELLNYTYLAADDVNATAGEGWYSYDENTGAYTKATGVTAALADSTINNMNTNLQNLMIGDVAGYTYNTTDSKWYTSDGEEATGILAELADLTVNDLTKDDAITDKIGNVKLGDALGYHAVYATDGNGNYIFDENGDKVVDHWEDENGEVTGIMGALVDKPIGDMGSAVDDLTLDQILPGERTGLMSIIPGNTSINNIDSVINDSLSDTALQFYLNNGLIGLDSATTSSLDELSAKRNAYTTFVNPDADTTNMYYNDTYKWTVVEKDGVNVYKVPTWRTIALADSFGYIVSFLSNSTTQPQSSVKYKLTNGTENFAGVKDGKMIASSDTALDVLFETVNEGFGTFRIYYYKESVIHYLAYSNGEFSEVTNKADATIFTVNPLNSQIIVGTSGVLGSAYNNKTEFGVYDNSVNTPTSADAWIWFKNYNAN